MKQEIKDKIYKINNGEIPEGYKKTNLEVIPCDWEETTLGSKIGVLTDYHANGSYEILKENVTLLDEKSYALMIRTTNFEKNDYFDDVKYIDEHAYNFLKKSKVFPKDILINKIANAGAVYLMPDLKRPVSLAMNLFLVRVKKCDPDYMFFYLKQNEHRLRILATGTTTKTITKDDVRSVRIALPILKEQQKIAKVIMLWDKAIQLKKHLIKEKEQQKQGMMRKLLTGELRLSGFDGEWKYEILNNMLNEAHECVGDRNIPPVAVGVFGIRARDEIFSKELSLDYSRNKVIKNGYLCFGIGTNEIVYDVLLEENEYCVSPAYKVFKIPKVNSLFLKLLLDINKKRLSKNYMIVSARQGKSIDFKGLLNETFKIPSIEEQKAISLLLSQCFTEIGLLEKECEALRLQKKGLMQLLLTGIVRVGTEAN